MGDAMEIRELRDADEPAVLRLLSAAMGWSGGPGDAEYFRWKHRENPFGRSPAWVAVVGEEIVGLRVFMRWELADAEGAYRVVRAVDTVTHRDHRGRGVFRALTEHALTRLEADGVGFVFNTPNQQSKPGYLRMGWEEVGRLPLAIRVRSPMVLPRLARSRVAADRHPVTTTVGVPAGVALEEAERLPGVATHGALATPRTPAFLRWRYGLSQLGYRGWEPAGGGLVLFRLRRRGRATELVVCDLLLPPHAERARVVSRLLRLTRADHALRIAGPGWMDSRLAPPGLGPVLVWRGLGTGKAPPLDRWRLEMGDVELF